MNPKSAVALVWMAVIANLLGLMVLSPAGQLPLVVIGVLLTIVPAIRARGAPRLAAAVVLVVSLALAASVYPEFDRSMTLYRERARARAAGDSVAPSQAAPAP